MRLLSFGVALLLGATVLSAESAGGLRWTMPAGWKALPERPMRAATYAVAPANGDQDPGECAIFFFGHGQGGTVADNLDRWRSQIVGTDGRPAPAHLDKRQALGFTVNRLDSSGSYTGMGGPMATTPRAIPGYRLLGALVEGPGGNNVFVKFTGPAKTVTVNERLFEQLLASFQIDK